MFKTADRLRDKERSVHWTEDGEITLKGDQLLLLTALNKP